MNFLSTQIGDTHPFVLIAGPCVIESESLCLEIAHHMKELTERLGMFYVFKASFDKANRSSLESFRGIGLEAGLKVLEKVRTQVGVPVLTDVHQCEGIQEIASVVDVLQIPAFLCRQTDLIIASAACEKPVNIKKGQFLSPWEMERVVEKAHSTGNKMITVCERGNSFGYNNLVVDMRSLAIMKAFAPVIFDATHAVQLPGQKGHASGGQREHVPTLARAAVAVGVSGLFMETHPDPSKALSDGPNSWPLAKMASLLRQLQAIDQVTKTQEV